MVKNYIKIAWRTMVKDKTYATINILGLTIGLCACMLVFTVVIDELSYDKFWSRADDLYKVTMSNKMADGLYEKNAYTPIGLGYSLKENFPEMEQFSNISTTELRLRIGKDSPDGIGLHLITADTNALTLLDFVAVSGQLAPFVAGHQNLLITESFYDKHFKGEDPIGKIIEDVPTWSNKPQSYVVTAIIKDIPSNTHLRADAVALTKPSDSGDLTKEGIRGMSSIYYLLKPGTDAKDFTAKINAWFQDFMENPNDKNVRFDLQPMTNVYLYSDFNSRQQVKGNIRTVYILSGVGVLLLLIACINFVNLSLARAMKRLKETGVRKIFGAQRKHLVSQFLTESLLFFLLSTLLAMALYVLCFPVVESFIGHGLTQSLLASPGIFGFSLLVIFLVSIVTGSYPAWLLSGFKPSNSLRGKLFQRSIVSANGMRKALVIAQFSMAIVVLVALVVVHGQISYMADKDIGYNRDNLLHIGLRSWEGKGETFKTELKKLPGIEAASIAGWDPVDGGTSFYNNSIDHPLKEGEKITAHFITADFDFVQTIGFQLQTGRHLNPAYGTDVYDMRAQWQMDESEKENYRNSRSSIITASTAKMLGISETGTPIPKLGFPAVGILKDFHRESLHHALGPVFIVAENNPDYAYMFIRTTPGMERQALKSLAELWKTFYPNRLLDAQWVTDVLDKQYQAEQKQYTLFSFFSALMLAVAAIGVFGLILHTAEQRVKEIGIRKVLGASVSSIVNLLSKDFVKLVLIAVVIASPIAWWAMNKWLEDFAYHIEIQWWMFGLAGLCAVSIALLTVGFQAVKAAVANPVESLRDE